MDVSLPTHTRKQLNDCFVYRCNRRYTFGLCRGRQATPVRCHDTAQFPPALRPSTAADSPASTASFLPSCPPASLAVGALEPHECGDFGLLAFSAAAAAAASTAPGGALARAGDLRAATAAAAAVAAACVLNLLPSRPAISYADPTAIRVWQR